MRLIARGDHLAAIKERGLQIRTPDEQFVVQLDATDDVSAVARLRLRHRFREGLFARRRRARSRRRPQSAARPSFRCSMASMSPSGSRSSACREASIIGGLAAVSLFRTAPGFIERRSPFDRIVLGELDRVPRERTTQLVDAFAAAGTTARVSDDMPLDLWRKFALIVPMNVACGLSRRPVGDTLARSADAR